LKVNKGVLGGTFDPVHNGHIMIAEEAISRLNLAEVLFVPAGQPWLKGGPILAAEHRVQMVRLTVAAHPVFKLSTMEMDRDGPSYAVDTIAELQDQLGAEDELFFILGWDSLAELPQWRQPARLITMCRLAVVPRPGYSLPDIEKLEAILPRLSQSVILLDKPGVNISATEIRSRVAQGLSIDHLVPEPVDEYIRQHGLFLP
jgi:nicotinate-nucleotide adenylyltransferase